MDVREETLRQATRLFAAKGFDGTSLKDIAEAVGVRKPSLLYHFSSKDELRRAVIDALLARWNAVLPRLLMAAASGEDRFASLMRETVRFFTENPDRARLLLREILDRPRDLGLRLETHVQPWVTVIADYIRKGQTTGEIHADLDPEAYILQVVNLVVSGVATGAGLDRGLLPPDPDADPEDRHARELIRMARVSLFTPRALALIASASENVAPENVAPENNAPETEGATDDPRTTA